ncbi:PREDICTED: synapse-associated protein of 47 kDa isoform X1 [Drosophila arizonae]|uniref:Synapse-associated protein of 47 kDa isoform X1 n=1 Tax=Drosophila arizonae TaxID=7263 RepID=A0ABM1PAM6_DROAR|nr:PREDICTED: synapse-associated protein of 47 kDa isoform X1 [Drosophila arizonae]XP_017864270.1 PREDICTED: synapse-associated protein of 47 kDa isoform X1 [Drosophila arizonae]
MFSGLTNQFTSLVGAVKGGAGDEDVPVPTGDAAAGAATTSTAEAVATSAEQDAAAAAGGEQLLEGEEGAKSLPKSSSLVDSLVSEATGWLGSAKGWLGNASIPSMPAMAMPSMPSMPAMPSIPSIPGLRKSGAADGAEGGEGAADAAAAGTVSGGDDDDKSRYISATEGADSHPASGGGTPTGDEGQIGQGKGDELKITTKVTQQAKHFGSFLSSAISKAGSKIKETVKDNTILESFNKEQEAFIKGQGGAGNGAAPWIGHANEAKIKEEILGLSQDRRNFVRAPPAGVDFDFSYDTAYPTAIAIMAEDKALETMRFELVPKIITEENFWRNYFYRVSLIIQAAELGTLGADGVGQASSGEDAANQLPDKQNINPTVSPVKTTTGGDSPTAIAAVSEQPKPVIDLKAAEELEHDLTQKISESEFVSDEFQTSNDTDLAEIQDGMRKLGIDSLTQQALASTDEEQWEKDLEAELKDYEVVDEGGTGAGGGGGKQKRTNDGDEDEDDAPTISNLRTRSTNNDWEEYADLIEDTDDLKTLKCLKRTMLGYL